MRRAAPFAAIVLLLLAVACGTKSREHENAQGAANLRAATVSIDVYWTAHNTYAGMTLDKLRSIDRSIKGISIVKTGTKAYCIETTAGDPHVFLNGPAGPFMLGSCGDPKDGKPYAPPPKMPPKEFGDGSSESSDASYPLRASIAVIETYYQDHNTYAGMTLAEFRYIDPWIPDISIVSAKKKTYCIEATGGDSRIFKNGPTGEMMIGSCADPTNGKPYEPPPSEEPEPSSSSEPLDAVIALRASIMAIEGYWQDHTSYAGMTVSKLRDIDGGLPDIKIVSAKKKTYCIEATAGNSRAFKSGPAGEIMLGSCGDPKRGKPFSPPPSEDPSSSSEPLDGPSALRASIPAIEAYWQDHTSYAGMTVSKLRETIDAGLPEIKIVSAKKKTYCIEIAVDGVSSFTQGPMGEFRQGHCPA